MLTVAAVLLAAHASLIPPCAANLPANVAPGLFRREMLQLLQRSETFREQCSRIAETRYVRIAFNVSRGVPAGSRAETLIERFDAGAIFATVTLRFGEDYIELIPHELEHIIEQIDQVRLDDEVDAQRAWRCRDGAFETTRAIAAGVRARQEFDGLIVEPVQADGRKPPALRNPFD